MRQIAAMLVVLAGLASTGLAQQPLGKGVNFYTREKEIALGRMLASELEKQHAPIRDPEITAYLDRVGQALATQPQAAAYTYTFTLVRGDGDVWTEPAALPGGWIFVDARSLATFENEAQFAGMLAHAIIHIAARHGTRMETRGQLVNIATIPFVYARGMPGVALPLGFLSFVRFFEREADNEGATLMAQAGYNPAELIRYFEKLAPGPGRSQAFSPHPKREDRIKAIQELIAGMPERTYSADTGNFDRIKALAAQPAPD